MKEPLYKQIYDALHDAILTGTLAPGSRVPTEKELSETYQVSRITSKRALTELEQNQLIYRVQGSGSFVRQKTSRVATGKILFVLPFANDLSLGNFTEGIYPIMHAYGYELLMTPADYLEKTSPQELMQEFDGMIYYASNTSSYYDLLFTCQQHGFPVVTLDKQLHDFAFPAILPDNFEGGQLAAAHLLSLGHQRIAYIFGSRHHPQSVRKRYLGYVETMQRSVDFLTKLDDGRAVLTEAVTYIQDQQITAAVCENDLVAIELMRHIRQHPQIPADFSIIGFDNIQAAALVDPALTTIGQNFAEMGRLAGLKVIEQINQSTDAAREKNHVSIEPAAQLVAVSLIIRESTIPKE
ncbi:LacI family DNA-binding transcriptional regulator [Enterococcus sp.]|uniref:GntR family transcriptional regulator n=1 Tax=Enterococcus sp. TaxID=35783 RepID=UPI0028985561|nr:LacI family DNA-binding transcriptional regulator [Enterococcus sp.]